MFAAYAAIQISLLIFTESKYLNENFLYDEFYKFAFSSKRPYVQNGNATELQHRFEVFKENLARARILNSNLPTGSHPVYGINQFADLSPEEFKMKYLSGYKKKTSLNEYVKMSADLTKLTRSLPSKVDWREKGVVNPVMDQHTCGACWAFSIVETVESMYGIEKNGSAPFLSVQQLIDCDRNNSGCEGGDIMQACGWSIMNGIVFSDRYPLTDQTDTCQQLSPTLPRIHVRSCDNKDYGNNESLLLDILAHHGPVAVAVDATTWHNYIGGIIQFHCSNTLNHAVQIVGYNLEGEIPFYIVRNSWGTAFGDNGYVYIKVGKNLCGLASDVTILNVDVNKKTNY